MRGRGGEGERGRGGEGERGRGGEGERGRGGGGGEEGEVEGLGGREGNTRK